MAQDAKIRAAVDTVRMVGVLVTHPGAERWLRRRQEAIERAVASANAKP